MEYLVTMTTHVPGGTTDEAVRGVRTREAAHSRDLAAQGHLLRLWRPPLQPGEWRSLGLFAAADGGQLEDVLASMPLHGWRTDKVTSLSPHPNDPAKQNHPDTEARTSTVVTLTDHRKGDGDCIAVVLQPPGDAGDSLLRFSGAQVPAIAG